MLQLRSSGLHELCCMALRHQALQSYNLKLHRRTGDASQLPAASINGTLQSNLQSKLPGYAAQTSELYH